MKLVNVDPIIEKFSGGESMKSTAECIHDEIFVDVLRNAPAVDAVEVIRCENCEHWKDRECDYFHSEYTTGNQVTNSTGYITRPEDYCSFARRKPDETNQKAIAVPAC